MKLPISNRLLLCASMVPRGARVADVGTDHGFLPVYLLQNGICDRVLAADLREKPLQTAKTNAARFGTAEQTTFRLSDGLHNIKPTEFDTLVCAGMGGDCIALILDAAPWLRNENYTLILQPQSSGNDLRRYLGENGYCIEEEHLVQDGRFLYAAMKVRFGGGRPLSAGEQYASPALLASCDPLLQPYLARIERSLKETVAGIAKGESDEDRRKLAYYSAALQEISQKLNLMNGNHE